jgi:hypothetical protein
MTMYEEAAKAAESEFKDKEVAKVKEWVISLLTKIEEKSKAKEKIEEEIRVLRKDLEDLKEGKLDKIKERQNKSQVAREISPLNDLFLRPLHPLHPLHPLDPSWWVENTSGTYNLTCSNGLQRWFKTIYL